VVCYLHITPPTEAYCFITFLGTFFDIEFRVFTENNLFLICKSWQLRSWSCWTCSSQIGHHRITQYVWSPGSCKSVTSKSQSHIRLLVFRAEFLWVFFGRSVLSVVSTFMASDQGKFVVELCRVWWLSSSFSVLPIISWTKSFSPTTGWCGKWVNSSALVRPWFSLPFVVNTRPSVNMAGDKQIIFYFQSLLIVLRGSTSDARM